jgi:3-methyladenine DNA glycosylase AlkD
MSLSVDSLLARMAPVTVLYNALIADLEAAGRASAYMADANEPDPRYKSYGVRAAGKRQIFAAHRQAIRALPADRQIVLAAQLIQSEYGEQQSIGLWILEAHVAYFTPDRFAELDALMRCLHGWSKIDEATGALLRDLLFAYPAEMQALVRTWNRDPDMWLRRASVVLFTRKVAQSGRFTDFALAMCENLLDAPEKLVQKGVGWALKDLLRVDKERIKQVVRQLRRRGVSGVITLYAIKDLRGAERAELLADRG